MYKYKPERNPRQAIILVLCLSVLSCAGFSLSLHIDNYRLFAQLIAVLFLAISIALVVRYTITEMEYTISPTDFSVSKTVGNRTTVLCSLDLSTAIALVDKETYLHSKEFTDVTIKYNHCQNIKAQSFIFVYEFNGKKGMIEFEPNTVFIKIMREAMDNARKKDKQNGDKQPTE